MVPASRRFIPATLPARLPAILFALGAVFYLGYLARHTASYASGSDASGYFNSARLLAQGRFSVIPRVPEGSSYDEFGLMTFQPLGFITDKTAARMSPTYPIGYPLHLLAASAFVGWRHAATLVSMAAALFAGVLTWCLARRLALPDYWAALAMLLLWLCPVHLFIALQPMSDQLAMLWSLATLVAALHARNGWAWSLACGFSLAMAVLVRPTALLLLIPVLAAIGPAWRALLLVGAGGIPGAAFLALYNWNVYGSVVTTGYGDVSTAFSRDFVAHNVAHIAIWLPTLLTPLVCAALVTPFLARGRRREHLVLAIWAVVLTSFYAFYYHTGEQWWYLRFILPAFPALILLALVPLHALGARLPSQPDWLKPVLAAALLVLAAAWDIKLSRRLDVVSIPRGEKFYVDTSDWASANLPAGSVVLCMQVSGSLFYYTDFLIVRWDQVRADKTADLMSRFESPRRAVYAALYDFEEGDFFGRIGGRWERISTVGNTHFWRMTAPP